MKFEVRTKNDKPYEWVKYTKNIFNGNFTHYMVLTSVENDSLLSREFNELLKTYKDVAYLDCKCDKFNWLKQFNKTKYTIASVEPGDEYKKFKKIGFEIVGFEEKPFNRLTMIKENF